VPDSPPPTSLRASFRETLGRAWRRLRGNTLTPGRAALSVAIGLFIGTLPLPGLHMPLVLAATLPFRLDAVVAYAAANISIPPIAPFLWLASLQLGARVLRGSFVAMSAAGARELVRRGPGALLASLALGSVMFGSALAALGAAVTYIALRARGTRSVGRSASEATGLDGAIERTARRYEGATRRRGTRYYVRGKLRGDPATRAVADLAPLGDVLDLGCGRGQLDVLLLEHASATSVLGVDWHEDKLRLARAAGSDLRATFEQSDVRTFETERSFDTVLLVDVLHYVDLDAQQSLLRSAAVRVREGGRLVIRDADAGRGWRSAVTRWSERISTAVRFNRGERIRIVDIARQIVPTLETAGFECRVEPCWSGTPFSNVLVVATRRARDV